MAKREMKVRIGARDEYSRVLKRFTRDFESGFNKVALHAKRFALVSGAALAGVGGALALITKSTATAGDSFAKMALRTGISAQALSELKHAAEISGASIEDFEKGMKTLSKRVSDARFGLETYQRIFRELGVEYQTSTGQLREVDAVFMDAVGAINRLGSETEKAAFAQELFGRAGTQLLPLIKSGKVGIQELREEAQRLGITFTDIEANQAAAFNDAMLRLRRSFTGVKLELGKELIPTFALLADEATASIARLKKDGDLDIWAARVNEGVITAFSASASFMTNLPLAWNAAMVAIKTSSAGLLAAIQAPLVIIEKFYSVLGKLPGTFGGTYRELAADIRGMNAELEQVGANLLLSAAANDEAGFKWGAWRLTALEAIEAVKQKALEAKPTIGALAPGAPSVPGTPGVSGGDEGTGEGVCAEAERVAEQLTLYDQIIAQSAVERANVTSKANRAMQDQMLSLIETGRFSVGAMAKIIAQQVKIELTGIAAISAVKAIYHAAMGLGAAASGNPAASLHFASASKFATVSGAAFAGAAATQGLFGGMAERPAPGTVGGEPLRTTQAASSLPLVSPQTTTQPAPVVNITINTATGDIPEETIDKLVEGINDGSKRNIFINFAEALT